MQAGTWSCSDFHQDKHELVWVKQEMFKKRLTVFVGVKFLSYSMTQEVSFAKAREFPDSFMALAFSFHAKTKHTWLHSHYTIQ